MPLPSLPATVAVQARWSGVSWDQANANLIGDCPVEVAITSHLILDSLSADTCRLQCLDAAKNLVPFNPASVVYPHVVPGVAVRVLERDASDPNVWHARFFGTMTTIHPLPEPDVAPLWVEIECESPLVVLAEHVVTLPTRAQGDAVRDAVQDLLDAVIQVTALPTNYFQLESWHRNTALPGAWGGGEALFGQALVELLKLAGAQAALVPQYPTGLGVDWRLRLWQATTTAAGTWSAVAGDIYTGSDLRYLHATARAA